METIKHEASSSGWKSAVESFTQDFVFSVRRLRKSPVFTALAILSLALGIGANTAIFTLIDDLMLKTLPVYRPDQLLSFGQAGGGGIIGTVPMGTSGLFAFGFFQQIKSEHQYFEGICASSSFILPASLRVTANTSQPASVAFFEMVSGNYFDVLGVKPILGRPILESDEDASGRSQVAIVSYHYWSQYLSSDPSVIGRSVTIDGLPFTIIGVAPRHFFGDKIEQQAPDLWLPLTMQAQVMQHASLLVSRNLYWLHLMGRRKANVLLDQAQAWFNSQVQRYMSDLEGAQLGDSRRAEIRHIAVPLEAGGHGVSGLRNQYEAPLKILTAAVGLTLLIACANLASFLLSRVVAREGEISTRLALGSSRSRIVRQILIETGLLSAFGGLLSLLFAFVGSRALIHFLAQGVTYTVIEPKPDLAVLLFTLGISIATAILFGIGPAIHISRTNIIGDLRVTARSQGSGAGASTRFALKFLVTAQVLLSVVLLVVAGLLIRTLRNLNSQDMGFEHRKLLMVQLLPELAGYAPEQLTAFYDDLLSRIHALPGVRSSALSNTPVISSANWGSPITIQGDSSGAHKDRETQGNFVSAQYFQTIGNPILRGRPIETRDTASSLKVAVVNQAFARRFFGNEDAIGRAFKVADPGVPGTWQIVGVASNIMDAGLRDGPQPMIYLPVCQISGPHAYAHWLIIDSAVGSEYLSGEVRRTISQLNPDLSIMTMEDFTELLDNSTSHEKLLSSLFTAFAMLALVLITIGLYSVATYSVVRRTNEIAIRIALGANGKQIVWVILKESFILWGTGVCLGIPLSVAFAKVLRAQLFGLSPFDPGTLVPATLLIGIVTLTAGLLPAARAARIDPMVALRRE